MASLLYMLVRGNRRRHKKQRRPAPSPAVSDLLRALQCSSAYPPRCRRCSRRGLLDSHHPAFSSRKVVSVFAPVWEEVIFRGFLLPSLVRRPGTDMRRSPFAQPLYSTPPRVLQAWLLILRVPSPPPPSLIFYPHPHPHPHPRLQARYLSIDLAIVVSALVFAGVHFSAERLLPLALLVRSFCALLSHPSCETARSRPLAPVPSIPPATPAQPHDTARTYCGSRQSPMGVEK